MNSKPTSVETESSLSNTSDATSRSESAVELSSGGFAHDTEVITTNGQVGVADLEVGDYLYAFNPETKLVKPKPVTAVQPVQSTDQLVAIQTRRADFKVAPDHRISVQTKSNSRTQFRRASDLGTRCYYKFVNEWTTLPGAVLNAVDITDFVTEYEMCATSKAHGHTFRAALPDGCDPVRLNSHTGYYFDPTTFKRYQSAIEAVADELTIHAGPNHHRRPYRFDGDDFIQFLGWYITEGSVYRSTSSDTAQVKIAQETEDHRQSIESLFTRMNLDVHQDERRFEVGSKVFGELLETLCGAGSQNKHLPEFVWDLTERQQRLLLEVLLWGDGNDRQTYYTSGERLASDLLRLCLELGIKPRYTHRDGIWQIYTWEVNDGFQPAQHVRQTHSDDDLIRLTVADYSVIMAGRNGKFQWIGVSSVS